SDGLIIREIAVALGCSRSLVHKTYPNWLVKAHIFSSVVGAVFCSFESSLMSEHSAQTSCLKPSVKGDCYFWQMTRHNLQRQASTQLLSFDSDPFGRAAAPKPAAVFRLCDRRF